MIGARYGSLRRYLVSRRGMPHNARMVYGSSANRVGGNRLCSGCGTFYQAVFLDDFGNFYVAAAVKAPGPATNFGFGPGECNGPFGAIVSGSKLNDPRSIGRALKCIREDHFPEYPFHRQDASGYRGPLEVLRGFAQRLTY